MSSMSHYQRTHQQQQHHHHQPHGTHHASPQPPATPNSIQDTRLGLCAEDLATLRRAQQAAHQSVRSPAGSTASSQGRLLLDPSSLTLLNRHFDQVMRGIDERLEQLNNLAATSTAMQSERVASSVAAADAEIARIHRLNAQIDELEAEFEKLERLQGLVRGLRQRVEGMERRFGN